MIVTFTTPNSHVEDNQNSLHQSAYVMGSAEYYGSRLADFSAAHEAIERLSFSEPDWDGDGALPITKEVKSNAHLVLEIMESSFVRAPEITPNANGTLSFEWETEEGAGQLEVGKTRFSFYAKSRTTTPLLSTGSIDFINRTFGMIVNDLLYPKSLPESAVTTLTTNV